MIRVWIVLAAALLSPVGLEAAESLAKRCFIYKTTLPSDWDKWPSFRTRGEEKTEASKGAKGQQDTAERKLKTVGECISVMLKELQDVEKVLNEEFGDQWPEQIKDDLLDRLFQGETEQPERPLPLTGVRTGREARQEPSAKEGKDSPKEKDPPGSSYGIGNLDAFLIEAHIRYKNLKNWHGVLSEKAQDETNLKTLTQRDVAEAKSDLAGLRKQIHDLMGDRGLRQPFTAFLDTGVVLASAGSDVDDVSRNLRAFEQSDLKTVPFGVVQWGSKHVGDHQSPVHFSLGGQIGYMPTMTAVAVPGSPSTPDAGSVSGIRASSVGMVQQASGDPTGDGPDPVLRSVFQEAFVWNIGPEVHRQLGKNSELTGYYRFGQSMLASENPKVRDDGGKEILANVVDNGVGRAAVLHELGAGWKYFTQDLSLLHDDHGIAKPAFEFAAGLRQNGRFRAAGLLDALGDGSPEQRVFVRFRLDLPTVLKNPKKGEKPETIAVAFAIDWEKGIGGRPDRLPGGTRIMFFGDVNLFKALKKTK